jgi:ribonuclease Z
MQLTISGYSTALFSTWYFIHELGVLFDCGDGVTASLLQKSRKIEHVFITHADRDHLTGLLQLNQLNAREGFPVIHYPADCGSLQALEAFSKKFDPNVSTTVWKKLVDNEKTWIRRDVYVQAIRNNHVPCPETTFKSLGYKIVQVKSKLKQEYASLSAAEIKAAIEAQGKAAVNDTIETVLLAYSGDTPCENFEHWQGAKILIHEATFLGGAEDKSIQTHGNRHSQLEDVIQAVSTSHIECLMLGHFSSRYSAAQIDEAILSCCKKYHIKIPVFRVLPGELVMDVLGSERIS